MAKHRLEKSQKKMKSLFDCKAKQRQFSPGEQVMFLLPVIGPPFQASFASFLTELFDFNAKWKI